MTTPGQFMAYMSEKRSEGDTITHQNFYTYANGDDFRLIEDLIFLIPNWVLGMARSYGDTYNKTPKGIHWTFQFFLDGNWKKPLKDGKIEYETLEKIKENLDPSSFVGIDDEFDLHFFSRMWMQYGSNVTWLPFSLENTGGSKFAYFDPTGECNVGVEIFCSRNIEDDNNIGYCIRYNDKEEFPHIREEVENSIKLFNEKIGVSLKIKEDENCFFIYIPLFETLASVVFKHQEYIARTLREYGERVKEKNEDQVAIDLDGQFY